MQKPIDKKIYTQGQDRNSNGRQYGRDVSIGNEYGIFPNHRTPIRGGWLDSQSQKTQRGNHQKDETKAQAKFCEQWRCDIGQYFTDAEPEYAFTP